MKRLIIVGDDFGYGHARNRGLVECFRQGAVTVLPVLAGCKHTNDAVTLAKKHNIVVGLHFNLTEGRPTATPDSVASLIGQDGRFLGKMAFWKSDVIAPDDVFRELTAQIQWFSKAFGRAPRRIDGHQHVHVHPRVSKIFSATLSRYEVQSTRLPVEHLPLLPSSSDADSCLPERKSFHDLVQSHARNARLDFEAESIRFAETFVGLDVMGKAMTPSSLQARLKSAFDSGARSCELMSHPGYACSISKDGFMGENAADSFSCSDDREHELDVLTSGEMLAFYSKEGIKLASE